MPKVRLPDGREVVFPDGMTNEQMQQAIESNSDSLGIPRSPELRNPTGSTEPFNPDRGASLPWLGRAGLGVKMTPEGKAGYLEKFYGKGNVQTDPSGQFFVREGGEWRSVDSPGLSAGDTAEALTPLGIEIAPALLSRRSTVKGQAGAGAAGAALRQGVSEMLPGDDALTLGDRLLRVGTDAALAGGSQFVVNRVVGLFDWARNYGKNRTSKAMEDPYAQEGLKLEQKTGIPMDVGQITGDKTILGVTGFLRRSPLSANKYQEFDDQQLATAVNKLDTTLDTVSRGKVGDATAGASIQRTFDDALTKALTKRRNQADSDFAAVDKAAGGQGTIDMTATVEAIDAQIRQFSSLSLDDATDKVLKNLAKFKENIEGKGGRVTAQELNRELQKFGLASAGRGLVLDINDKAQSRGVATTIFKALNEDLDHAAGSLDPRATLAQQLKAARDNYKTNSQAVEDLKEGVLGRYFGVGYDKDPTRTARMIKGMTPTELGHVVTVFNSVDPDGLRLIRRNFLEDALKAAKLPAGQQGKGVNFSAGKFVNALPDEDQMRVLFRDDPGALKQMGDVVKVLTRIANHGGTAGSPTNPLNTVWDVVKGVFTINPVSWVKTGAVILGTRQLADIMTTQKGRQALLTVTNTAASRKAIAGAMTYLAAVASADTFREQEENVRPMQVQ
jgi:hypothetical protein